jgi:hypothetical protein
MAVDVDRAIQLNRKYMAAQNLGWQSRYQQVAQLLGFSSFSPDAHSFALAVARWQQQQQPPLASDGIIGPKTWARMQAVLAPHVGAPGVPPGPQSFAPAVPGSARLDPMLVARNRTIEQALLREADAYLARGDFRWFFTYAHGRITAQINANLIRFQRPNELMRLNIHFAEQFIRAIGGQPHDRWREAFRRCELLRTHAADNVFLVGEVEFCSAAMARVHISIDLAAALREVGCIPPSDYGNMLVFVNQGALAAAARYRGRYVGTAEVILQQLTAPLVDLEVKVWRNAAYQNVCGQPVPDPAPSFVR